MPIAHAITVGASKRSGIDPTRWNDSGRNRSVPMATPRPTTTRTWVSSPRTRVDERAPTARSNVSVRAFCRVTIRKKRPMTSGTTSP